MTEGTKYAAVVEDDAVARRFLSAVLQGMGYTVREHADGRALLALPLSELDFVCVDLGLGEESGLDLIAAIRAQDPDLPLLVVTAERELASAVQAMRAGAWDYIAKPVEPTLLAQAARRASERRALSRDVSDLRRELGVRQGLGTILGRSAAVRTLRDTIERVLESDVSVCVLGESGTGKELVARALHQAGKRKQGPFVALNCGAIPSALQESELFGHERGAFTGATGVHKGRFEQAHRGTLFLDEIGEMSAATQASLLRTLQERTVRRIGGAQDLSVDVRIVCATHRDLEAESEAGRFRHDLFYRLMVYPIRVPPLRERLEDLPILVGHFLRRFEPDVGRTIERVTPEFLDALARHDWPGNIRELENLVHRAMLTTNGSELDVGSLPASLQHPRRAVRPAEAPAPRAADAPRASVPPTARLGPARTGAERGRRSGPPPAERGLSLAELERDAISSALERAGGNVTRAAKLLGLGRATLYRRLASREGGVE
jgi:DNA-binding NtrC family response regulator